MPAMQSRARFAWRVDKRRNGDTPTACWLRAGSKNARDGTLPDKPAGSDNPAVCQDSVPFNGLAPQKPKGLLEGFCPEPRQEEQIAVNSNGIMLFLQLADIEWVEAADNGVDLHVGPKTHRFGGTLGALAAKLPRNRFLRISHSTLVNIEQIKELQPMFHGEYEVLLRNGTRLTVLRGYGGNLRQTGLSHGRLDAGDGQVQKEGGLPAPLLASREIFNRWLKRKPQEGE